MNNRTLSLWLVSLVMGTLAGCFESESNVSLEDRPIAVTVLEVQPSRLKRQAHLTGSVLPWKKEELKFQTAGKLMHLRIVTPGKQVRGELKDEFGKVLYRGEVIASLDPRPFELALQQAEAEIQMAQIKLEATRHAIQAAQSVIDVATARFEAAQSEIDELLPLGEKIAEENYKLAETISKNTEEAYKSQDVTHSKRAEARTTLMLADTERKKVEIQKDLKLKELKTYKADIFRAQMDKQLQEAEAKIAEAQVRAAASVVERARQELDKCVLRAPFDGVISEIYVNPGVMVDPSVPIATLVMMDPVRVDMAVSFQKLRDFHFGNEVKVYPTREKKRWEKGNVYHIHTTADPSTRTFLAIIAVRNRACNLDSDLIASQKEYQQYRQIKDFSGVVHRTPLETGNLYVDVRCVQRDDKGYFVWKVAQRPGYRFNPEAVLQKIYIELGEDYINVITWLFRELKNHGGLDTEDILLIRPTLLIREHVRDMAGLMRKLREGKDPLSRWIYGQFSPYSQNLLEKHESASADETSQRIVLDELNQIIQGDLIFEKQRFSHLAMPSDIKDLLQYSPKGENLAYLNRLLMEEGYSKEIVRSHEEYQVDQKIIQLREDWLFHPGELVEVEYDRELPNGLYLPSEAILSDRLSTDENFFVFVVEPGKDKKASIAKHRPISTRRVEDLWEVKGLNEGEKIVIHGAYTVNNRYDAIRSDIPVHAIKEEALAELLPDYSVISDKNR